MPADQGGQRLRIRSAGEFRRDVRPRPRNGWRVEPDIVIDSDFSDAGNESTEGKPLRQQYAWLWEKGQKLPHKISDNVYEQIRNQIKISSFLFLRTEPNELLYMTGVPNPLRPWRAMTGTRGY